MARSLARDDGAVTPILGTILVLAISVAGIGLTLFMGLPVLQRIQDQASLESALGQMKELRAEAGRLGAPNTSIASGFNLPGGTLSIEPGTRTLVTLYNDTFFPNCDLRIRGWDAGGSDLTFSYTTTPSSLCRTPAVDQHNIIETPLLTQTCVSDANGVIIIGGTSFGFPAMGCLHAYKVVNGAPQFSTDYVTEAGSGAVSPCTNLVVVYNCAAGIHLTAAVGTSQDWLFRLDNDVNGGSAAPGNIYWQAWLLHADRLVWSRASGASAVKAVYENGALFSQSQSQYFLQSPAPMVENASLASTYPAFLRLPTWQSSGFGATSGQGAQVVRVTYANGSALASPLVYQARLDFQGDLAQAWCNAFLQRNQLPTTPSSTAYRVDGNDATRNCNASSPSSDKMRGLLYDAYPSAGDFTQFRFSLVQQILNARLDS